MESLFAFEAMKRLISDCKNLKTCCYVLNTPFTHQNPTTMFFWHDMKDKSRLGKRRTFSMFEAISQPITIKHSKTCANKGKNHFRYGIIVSTHPWLIQLTKNSITLSFLTIWVYSKTKCFLSVSRDGFECALDFGSDSMSLTVEDLVH